MRRQLGLQVTEVDGAVRAALDYRDPEPGQHRAGRVGAVRRLRDQAHVPVLLAARGVVGPDRQQAGQFALGAGVRLDGHRVVAGEPGQPDLERVDQLQVASGLRGRDERMQPGELRPADRLHLGRRVQLHRARAERDHRAVQGDVEVGQPSQVAQHRGLAAVSAEHRMGEERRGAPQAGRQHVGRRFGQLHVGSPLHLADRGHDLPQLLVGGGLVAAGLQRAIRRQVQVVARGPGPVQGVDRLVPSAPEDDPDSVEEVTTVRSVTIFVQGGGEHRGATVRTPGDGGQPVGPVIGGVHGGGHGQQDLGRADVAGRLLAADVLFTGLQREAVGGPAVGVHRHPDQSAGQLALKRVADRDVTRVRPAEEQWHAEPLAGAHRDVRAQLAGRHEQGEREQVGGHRGQRAAGVRGLDQRP